jgi:methionyl-tRNA formyltransferase
MAYQQNSDVKVLYLGTPEISALSLQALIDAKFSVVGLVCQEDKETGREGVVEICATKKVALAHDIPVFQPHKIRLDFEWAKKLHFDVIVCMAYGQIVPLEFLQLAPKGALNLHGSLLPKYRGAAPIQRALMNGETVTGVTLMEMVAAMDAGRMYNKVEIKISEEDNYWTLSRRIGEAAAGMIGRDLLPYCNDELKGQKQREKDVTLAPKILPEDEHLPLTLSVKGARNYVRALAMAPGAYVLLNGKKLKIFKAHIENSQSIRAVGEIIPDKKEIFVQFYDGWLSLDLVQLEGKKMMDAPSFLNGAHLSDHELVK